jgi:hypothetical protein
VQADEAVKLGQGLGLFAGAEVSVGQVDLGLLRQKGARSAGFDLLELLDRQLVVAFGGIVLGVCVQFVRCDVGKFVLGR